jgi:hypothetical protein
MRKSIKYVRISKGMHPSFFRGRKLSEIEDMPFGANRNDDAECSGFVRIV